MKPLGVAVFAVGLVSCGDAEGLLTCTGSGDPEALRGSYCEGSEISWDTVGVGYFPPTQTLRVRYGVAEPELVSPRFEIQVFGDQVRLAPGASIPLAEFGNVRRWPDGGRDPQNLTPRLEDSSQVVFDALSPEVGGEASGRFDLLLDTGRTLRGVFSGTLEDLSPPGGG